MVVMEIHVTWDEIFEACRFLYNKIKPEFKVEQIIGIGHGGWIPSVILANKFNCNIFPFNIKFYNNRKRHKLQVISKPSLENFKTPAKTLIVDDICDSGLTLKFMVKNPLIQNGNIKTAVIFKRANSKFEPDYYWKQLYTDKWIVFPWEEL
jgi:hypothetical protein